MDWFGCYVSSDNCFEILLIYSEVPHLKMDSIKIFDNLYSPDILSISMIKCNQAYNFLYLKTKTKAKQNKKDKIYEDCRIYEV